jgi:alpha-glucosidase (family GH31 glycosyl hydrolase)
MKRWTFLISFLLSFQILIAQNSDRKYLSHTVQNEKLIIKTSDGNYEIKFYNPEIVETGFIPKDSSIDTLSHAVVLKTTIPIEVVDEETSISMNSSGICVSVQKKPFQIHYNYKEKYLLSEKMGYQDRDSLKALDFSLETNDILYGGGARVLGMNRRGNKLPLYNRAHYGYETHSELMNYTMPVAVSSKIFTIHFDNAPIGFLDLDSKKNNTLTYETISGRMVYQIIAGNTWQDLVQNFTALTGRQPMPPRWAFGNFASRFGYHSQEETEKTVAQFQEEKIPLDAVVIDIYWFGKGIFNEMGNLEFYKDSFPEPEKMMQRFRKKGIKTVLVTEPFILTTSKKWDEAVRENILVKDSLGKPKTWDFYFGNTSLIDIYNPKAEKWFWDFYKKYTDKGVAGWWGDLGEPEVHPSDAIHFNGTADEVHNIYGHDWARLVYEGFERDFPDTRPFILMRAGAVGSQRYGMIPWTGDVNRTWGGLQAQPEIALQMGLQGIGYMHSDLGGFAGENLDDELYTRWLQYGVFQPIYRPHAQEQVASEPIYRSVKAKTKAKESIELRYKLLPYIYTLAFENHTKGLPFMRPLFFAEPDNKNLLTYKDAYLWGEDMLIAPVVEAGKKTQNIYFPKGNNWYDFYSSEKYSGGKTHTVTLNENYIPTFIKGGSFIPQVPVFQSTDDYNIHYLDVHYFYDDDTKTSYYEMYNDDGKTPDAYEKYLFETLEFFSKKDKKHLTLRIEPDYGVKFSPYKKHIELHIHNLNQKPKKVKINGKKVKFKWKTKASQIIKVPFTIEEQDVIIKFKF